MDYNSIDIVITNWTKRHGLKLFTRSGDTEIRNVYLSSTAGECYQIWIDPPVDAKVIVHAACVEGQKDNNLPRDWSAPIPELDRVLEEAFATVIKWMEPADRYYPTN